VALRRNKQHQNSLRPAAPIRHAASVRVVAGTPLRFPDSSPHTPPLATGAPATIDSLHGMIHGDPDRAFAPSSTLLSTGTTDQFVRRSVQRPTARQRAQEFTGITLGFWLEGISP